MDEEMELKKMSDKERAQREADHKTRWLEGMKMYSKWQ
jgi:hypothetical protein